MITDKNQVGGENQVECDVYIQNSSGDRLVGGKATVVLPLSKQEKAALGSYQRQPASVLLPRVANYRGSRPQGFALPPLAHFRS